MRHTCGTLKETTETAETVTTPHEDDREKASARERQRRRRTSLLAQVWESKVGKCIHPCPWSSTEAVELSEVDPEDGEPLCALVGSNADRIVAELSSFQLEHARRLRVAVAVLLNLAPDHLDRHGTLAAYGAAKARLAELQTPEGTVVYNVDDPWARETAARSPGRRVPFSAERVLSDGAFLKDGTLVVVDDGRFLVRHSVAEISRAARTPVDNALASAAAALAAGASPAEIARVLSRFEGLPHRATPVGERAGVRFVDDSKATNPTAAVRTLESCEDPVVWIAGGRNKGLDLDPLRHVGARVRLAVLYGEAAPELERVLGGALPLAQARTLDRAFAIAAEHARAGEMVVLSPACASQDQFRSFEERGERFVALVRNLPERSGEPC